MESPSEKIEIEVRRLLAGGEESRQELNDLLRRCEKARSITAAVLAEEAALIGELRGRQSEKWAESLDEKIFEAPGMGGSTRNGRHPAWHIAIASTALAACLAIALLIVLNRNRDVQTVEAVAKPEAVWIGLISAIEGEDGSHEIGTQISRGELELGEQKVRIDLYNGVKLSICGPARLDIEEEGCRLWNGELGVDTGVGARSFPVETTLGKFIDQGTVFSVSVDPGGRTAVSVSEGSVVAELLTSEGDVISRQQVSSKKGIVVGQPNGEFELVNASTLNHEPILRLNDAPLEVPTAYRDLVLKSDPMILWSFESGILSTGIPNTAGDGFLGLVNGTIGFEKSSAGNRFAVFGKEGDVGSIRPIDKLVMRDDTPLTIELWVRPDRIHHGHLINLGVHNKPDPITGVMGITPLSWIFVELMAGDAHETFPKHPSLRAGFRSPPCLSGHITPPGGVNVNLFHSRYSLGEWSQVVVRVDGEEMAMFVNGTMVSREPLSWMRGSEVELEFLIGRLDSTPRTGPMRPFAGALDEVAIYERALADEEILEHFKAMGSQGSHR